MSILSKTSKIMLRAAAFGGLAFGCIHVAAAEDITLDVMYPWPELKSFQEPLAEQFMKENPDIKIKFRLSPADYTEANLAIARGSLTGDLPDVYFSGYSELKSMVETLSKRGQFVPLTPFISAEKSDWVAENFGSALFSLGRVNGTQYAIPFNASTPIVYFNADLVKKAGHDPNAFPKDWEGIIALAKDINALSNDVNGLDFSVGSISSDWVWQATVLSLGGAMVSADGAGVGFNDKIGLEAMKLLQRISLETKMNVATTGSAFQQQFFAGKLGLFVASPSSIANFTRSVGGRFEMRTAPFPIVAKEGGLPTGGNAVAIIAKDEAHKAAAWRYVEYLTGPDAQAYVAKSTGYMPTNLKAGESLKDFYGQNPTYATAFKQVGVARPWYSYPRGNSKEIWSVQRKIFDQLQRGNIPPEQALKDLVSTTESKLKN